jgi:hypothetical protein
MNEDKIEIIKDSLNKLISTSIWFITVACIAALNVYQTKYRINYNDFTIEVKFFGWILFLICNLMMLMSIKNMDTIVNNVKALNSIIYKDRIVYYLRAYSHIFNPFTGSIRNLKAKILDFWGTIIIGITPIIYQVLAVEIVKPKGAIEWFFIIILVIITGYVATERVIIESLATNLICDKKKEKYIKLVNVLSWFCFAIYLLFIAFYNPSVPTK